MSDAMTRSRLRTPSAGPPVRRCRRTFKIAALLCLAGLAAATTGVGCADDAAEPAQGRKVSAAGEAGIPAGDTWRIRGGHNGRSQDFSMLPAMAQSGMTSIFVSIGEVPTSGLAKDLGVELDGQGYIKIDAGQRTSVPLVYAAGDVTGGFRQVITACSEGAICANSAHADVTRPYWTK